MILFELKRFHLLREAGGFPARKTVSCRTEWRGARDGRELEFHQSRAGGEPADNIELNLEADSRRDVRSLARKARLTATSGGRRLGRRSRRSAYSESGHWRLARLAAPPQNDEPFCSVFPVGGRGGLATASRGGWHNRLYTRASAISEIYFGICSSRCYLCRDSSFSPGR